DPRRSFWDFTPEQQGMIVENTFLMRESGRAQMFDASGRPWTEQRPTEIARLLPIHERYVAQMRAALPERQVDIITQRAGEVVVLAGDLAPASDSASDLERPGDLVRPGRQLAPIKPILEIRF